MGPFPKYCWLTPLASSAMQLSTRSRSTGAAQAPALQPPSSRTGSKGPCRSVAVSTATLIPPLTPHAGSPAVPPDVPPLVGLTSPPVSPGLGDAPRALLSLVSQPLLNGSVEPMGHEISVPIALPRRSARVVQPSACALSLSHAVLDVGLPGWSRAPLFVSVDEAALMSSMVEVVCAPLGVLQLPPGVPAAEPGGRRIAQLHARGYRFAMSGLQGPDDPRWRWAPLMRYLKLDIAASPPCVWPSLLTRARTLRARLARL